LNPPAGAAAAVQAPKRFCNRSTNYFFQHFSPSYVRPELAEKYDTRPRTAVSAVTLDNRHYFNPLPPSGAVRQQKKNILEDFFSSVLAQFKKYYSSGNLKFNYLGTFQSLKLRISMEKILSISPKQNFTPNTLGGYELKGSVHFSVSSM